MKNSIYQQPLFYQSANVDDETIKATFIVRRHEYDIIIQDILRNPMKGSVQHYLLIGLRGSGKSTLLKRIQVEITSNAALKGKYIPINLAEEQANIYKLYDLLEEVIRELEQYGISQVLPEWNSDIHIYTRQLFDYIQQIVTKSRKKIILLLDNIDRIFENIEDEASLLREYLLNYDNIRIIGGSTRMTEHFWRYNKPFYQFFRVLELKALTAEEVKTLLLGWSEQFAIPQLKTFIETRPGQLEAIRILTDGLPRTLQFFVNILLTNAQDTGYEYLRHIMDNVTPLYQERLNTLPTSQRKIVLQMAFIWEATGAGKLAEATKINNYVISAQLKQLSDKGIVEKLETGGKNHLYRLTERFFNLWLIFTQGSPVEKRKAKYLTIFLENFYDAEQIQTLAREHLRALKKKTLPSNKAVLLTKAFSQSQHINLITRDHLINKTLQLENITAEVKNQLPPTLEDITQNIIKLLKNKKFDEISQITSTIEHYEGSSEFLQAITSYVQKRFEEAEQDLKLSIHKGFPAFNMLAVLYEQTGASHAAEEFYLKAIKYTDSLKAHYNLGIFYLQRALYKPARKVFVTCIKKDHTLLFKIASLFMDRYMYTDAEFFFRRGAKIGIPGAATEVAIILFLENRRKQEAKNLLILDQHYHQTNPEQQLYTIAIKVWFGDLSNLKESTIDFVVNHTDASQTLLLTLLYLNQLELVCQIFTSSHVSALLQERFKPLYYAVLILVYPNGNNSLITPPEIVPTVDAIIDEIKDFIEHYKR